MDWHGNLFISAKQDSQNESVRLFERHRSSSVCKTPPGVSLVPAVGEVGDFVAIPLRRVLTPDLHGLHEAQVGIVLKWAEAVCTDILSS